MKAYVLHSAGQGKEIEDKDSQNDDHFGETVRQTKVRNGQGFEAEGGRGTKINF